MIELRVLGPISLKGSNGSDVAPILAQPKRLALAAYLAAPPPHGGRCFHRKDTLVAMFWPELNQQHARAALRNALYFLRQQLGASVVVGHGDEEVGLDQDQLWCDADAFDTAFRCRDYRAASRLYRGEMLHGVFVSGSPPFEEWLDAQRQRRRNEAQEAAMQTGGRHAAAGRLDDALTWARHAQALAPLNESCLRMVVALHYLLGDRAEALDVHHRFEALLAEELDVPPAQETQRLIEAVRRAPENDSVANTLAKAQLPWLRLAPGAPEAAAGLYDRKVLEALTQKRLGHARRVGERVGLVLVTLGESQPNGARATEKEMDRAVRELARIVVRSARESDLVALIEPATLIVLPTPGMGTAIDTIVDRMRARLRGAEGRRAWASVRTVVPDPRVVWLDPETKKSAAALLTEAVG